MELEIGQKVTIIIGKETSLGFIVLIEESLEGLVYKSEVFSDLEEGITPVGYIKNIRADEKIDVSLKKNRKKWLVMLTIQNQMVEKDTLIFELTLDNFDTAKEIGEVSLSTNQF